MLCYLQANRHVEALLAEQNRHREEMAFYRTLTVAGVLALVVLLLGITLAFIAQRRASARPIYILPEIASPAARVVINEASDMDSCNPPAALPVRSLPSLTP